MDAVTKRASHISSMWLIPITGAERQKRLIIRSRKKMFVTRKQNEPLALMNFYIDCKLYF
jgi:hypothetical protein